MIIGSADKRTGGQADKRTGGQADWRTSGQADRWTSGQVDKRIRRAPEFRSESKSKFDPGINDGSEEVAVIDVRRMVRIVPIQIIAVMVLVTAIYQLVQHDVLYSNPNIVIDNKYSVTLHEPNTKTQAKVIPVLILQFSSIAIIWPVSPYANCP